MFDKGILKRDIQIKRISSKTNDFIEKIINKIIFFILFINPFIIFFTGGKQVVINNVIIDCYTDIKVVILWMLSFILFVLFIIKREFKFDLIEWMVLAFLAVVTMSTVNSINPIVSFFGAEGRREGLLSFYSYGIIFIMVKRYFIITKRKIDIFLSLGVIMSIYGVLQFYSIDPITTFYKQGGQTVGTIGHRNFFASYLIILLAISISKYIFSGERKYLIFNLFYFSSLICTLTRGAWLSLGVLCLIGLIFILKRKDCLKRATVVVLSFIFIFLVLGFASGDRVFGRAQTIKSDIVNLNEKSGSGRVYVWKTSYKVFKKYPILGTGPEALGTSIRSDFEEELVYWRRNFEQTFIDKAHNELLNIAATTGIFSLIIYLSMVIIILIYLFKRKEDDNIKILIIIILGYLTQGMFNISVIAVAPIFWSVLAIGSRSKYNKNILNGK